MKRETLSFPRKKAATKPLSLLGATQFALERAVKRIAALEKQCDGLAKFDKEKDIAISLMQVRMRRFEKRLYGGDSE